eukprot:UN10179
MSLVVKVRITCSRKLKQLSPEGLKLHFIENVYNICHGNYPVIDDNESNETVYQLAAMQLQATFGAGTKYEPGLISNQT